jgi:hypothetical protein
MAPEALQWREGEADRALTACTILVAAEWYRTYAAAMAESVEEARQWTSG